MALSIFMSQFGQSQTLIEIEENSLLLGGKPAMPYFIPVPFSSLDSLFAFIQNEKIEHRYVNGSCEDRAHYISLLLKKMNVESGKIWNYAPARVTLISNELFKVNDPYGISDTVVHWGYHVAPVFTAINEQGQIDTLVIDQSFSPHGFLHYKNWLKLMKCPRSVYTFTGIESYLFNSLNGLTIYDNKKNPPRSQTMPEFLPQIITGDFWQLNSANKYVQAGLAINDLAYYIATAASSGKYAARERTYLLNLIKNIKNLDLFTKTPRPPELSINTHRALSSYYKERFNHWDAKYSLLN